ncbi:PTS sugar transporter subunit IIA [Exiguobacterium sp. SL14]|nr:PTS sugar transporter subunit IIA [Exiguobacterium sp. SL14]MCY1690826.1 PTS sugar transporter subunit IIA [Exiguobacterium sp. SL14]
MHFGAVLSKPTPKLPYRVLVVCSAGLGSSKLLMNRLRQEFTELEHIDNSSLFGIERLPIESYDFVLSTVPLPDIRPPHLLVNPLLPQDEVERIRKLILALPKSFQPAPRQTKSEWLDLEQPQRLVTSAIQVTNGFKMDLLERVGEGIESLLFEISTRMVEQGIAKSAVALSTQLLRRHEMSGLGIPGTRLALFHGRDATIQQGGFLIFELPEPIDLLGMDQQLQSVERSLVLVALMEETSNELLELLSSISAAIIESPEQMDQFEFGEEPMIRSLLNQTFRTVIDQVLGHA